MSIRTKREIVPLKVIGIHVLYFVNTFQLISGGADPTDMDADGYTPLYKAILYNQPMVVESLVLAAGVDLNTQDTSGTTALHVR